MEVAHFRYFFLNDGVPLPKIVVRVANFVSEDDVFVYLSHGISHRDAIRIFAGVSFRVNLYRRTPLPISALPKSYYCK